VLLMRVRTQLFVLFNFVYFDYLNSQHVTSVCHSENPVLEPVYLGLNLSVTICHPSYLDKSLKSSVPQFPSP
jgi:hypothetical protein